MKRRLVALTMALLMALGLLPALARAEGTPEPLTVSVFVGDAFDQPAADNKIFKLIEQELGIKFQFEFLAGDLDETLGIKVAGQDYADLMSPANSPQKLIDAGALIDLMPYISAEKTPNLWAQYSPYFKRIQDENGKLFIFPNYGRVYNNEIVNFQNGPAFFIQKKVLAWDKYPKITTLDQYFDLLERYKTANPTTADGLATTGFEILCDGWRNFCLLNPPQHLQGHPNDGGVFVHWDDNYKVDVFHNKPYAEPYWKKLNEVFNKGMIDQDTFVENFDQYIAKLSSGRVLGMFDQYWDFQNATDSLISQGKFEDTYVALPLVYDESIKEHYLDQTIININRGYGISVNCKDPERLVQMFDTLLSDKWQKILWWGVEGEDYTVDANGRMLMSVDQMSHIKDAAWIAAHGAKAFFYNAPKKEGTMDDGNSWDPQKQPEMYFDSMQQYDKDFLTAYGFKTWAEFFTPALPNQPYYAAWQIDLTPYDDMPDISKAMGDIQARDIPQMIMCKPEEFQGKWDTFVTTLQNAGEEKFEQKLQEIILDLNAKRQ